MTHLHHAQRALLQFLLNEFQEDGFSNSNDLRMLTLLYNEHNLSQSTCRRPNIERERITGHDRLMKDYFVQDSIYTSEMFRRRFRMRRPLFEKIVNACTVSNEYFVQKRDAVGLLGLTPIQKITAAIRMLAYDKAGDELDEYIRVGESTVLRCLKEFCQTVIAIFGDEYLRAPTPADLQRILRHSAQRGFPGMVGSLDCMHWEWKNCPKAWAGQFQGKSKSSTIVLEAVATYDLWVWHAFFGMSGSCNDINVLDRSHLFAELQQGRAPSVMFTLNNHTHHMGYYLTDGIYPKWPVFVQTISEPMTEKRKHFAKMQEATRKDIERCFGVLQARWAIIKNPSRLWKRSTLHNVMTAAIILHNMIVEDEHDVLSLSPEIYNLSSFQVQPGTVREIRLPGLLANRASMKNQASHHLLQSNLVEHLWLHRGQQ